MKGSPALGILGGSGLILSRLIELHKDLVVSSPDISDLDITDRSAILEWIKRLPVGSTVVLGAAYTDVDGAEKEKGEKSDLVYKVNVEGPRNVSLACRETGALLIHISTDFVFAGTDEDKGPYQEDKIPTFDSKRLGWYAQTKLMAEQEVSTSGAKAAIVRFSYPFRSRYEAKLDFARKILVSYDKGQLYPMFNDQYLTPTFIDEAADVIVRIASSQGTGVFHSVSNNVTTPYEFATRLLERARNAHGVVSKSSIIDFQKEFPEKAPRPQFGGLAVVKTQERLGIKFMTWQEQIDTLVAQMKLA